MTAIEKSKDLSTLLLDELIGNLKVYEVVLEKDSKASKNNKEKYKLLALKAKKVSSNEEVLCSDSDDEEYVTAVRGFKKFFKRRGKFVRQPHDDKKNFQREKEEKKRKEKRSEGCWSESEEDDDSKKDEICLMAHDTNEKRLERLEKNKEISVECKSCIDLRTKIDSLSLKLAKFENSSHFLQEMIENQRLQKDKKGLGFTDDKASTSEVKTGKIGTGVETIVYADSDHAGDYVDRKSTSDVCIFMGCCLTSWFSKKQISLAISTTEAKYVSAGKACQQALWMKQALVDYDIKLNDIPVLYDNKGAIDLSKNYVLHSHTKHIEICHHFLRDNVQKGNISIEKVSSDDNIVDIFTKPLKREPFNLLRLGLGLMEPTT
ncbi:hypothetical protein Tco_0255040 [Tanacetum coccineum]